MKNCDSNLVFKNGESIGATEAESDQSFLSDCFVEIDGLGGLVDLDGPQRSIVGRTRNGKSAIIENIIATKDCAIRIKPSELSLEYIANSSVIAFFETAGISLERFYKALWQHVITVIRHGL